MKLKLTKGALLEGLLTVQNVVNIRSTLPILSNVLLKADKNHLWLTTTDIDVSVCCGLEAEVTKGGASTLPARRLVSIVRELPDNPIELDIDEKNMATIKCGSSFFKLNGLSEDEFPPVTKPEGKFHYKLEQSSLKEMLKKIAYAASSDETRYVLNGVLMSFKDSKLTMVATDGRRLALIEKEVEVPTEAEVDMILPSKVVNELQHTLKDTGDLKIFAKENQVVFEFGDVVITSKLIEGVYPNYRQVIPSQCEERVTVERESLLTALRRVSLVTTDRSAATKLTFGKNKVIIATTTPDVGEARETIPIKYSGKEISVAFNPEYMMDPLKTLSSDEVFVELTDDLSPGVIKCEIPFLYVIMPMKIS